MFIAPSDLVDLLNSAQQSARWRAMKECADMPLDEAPTHPEERLSVAHLRDVILRRLGREVANRPAGS